MGLQPTRSRYFSLIVVAAAVVALGACSGSDGKDSTGGERGAGDGADRSSTTSAAGDRSESTDRPEGSWTLVSYGVSRSDDPTFEKGEASVRLFDLEPDCDQGPCNITVSPGGNDGTFLADDEIRLEETDYDMASFELTWDASAETYSFESEPEEISCRLADADPIEAGYSRTNRREYTFAPATDEKPERLSGTNSVTFTPTAAGEGGGCTPFVYTEDLAGSPTGSLNPAASDLAGSYIGTWVVAEDSADIANPDGQNLSPGQVGSVGTWTFSADGDAASLIATVGERFALTDTDQGWTGQIEGVTDECVGQDQSPLGLWDVSESVSNLNAVALTDGGLPIISGSWSFALDPQPDARQQGCATRSQSGLVTLIPLAALG